MLPDLRCVVCLEGSQGGDAGVEMQTYNTFTSNGHSVFMNDSVLKRAESLVRPGDVLNLQFTSGMNTFTAVALPSILTRPRRNHWLSQSSHANPHVSLLPGPEKWFYMLISYKKSYQQCSVRGRCNGINP
jgi:hypothetical protein